VFSERYMGMPWPQDNFINYEKTDLTRKLSSLKGKTFLLVHGTIDKRVNIQHSMLLIKSLTEQGVQFKIQVNKVQ
jgi:dipeptidyl aminopeptidase/acylaminoacyl peptidase